MRVSRVRLAELVTFVFLLLLWAVRRLEFMHYFIIHIMYLDTDCIAYRVNGFIQMFQSLFSPLQVCVHSHGSPGPAADGLPLPEHQPVCGEFPQDGAQAVGVRQTQPADPRNQLCEFTEL